jgi:hypothetical protein
MSDPQPLSARSRHTLAAHPLVPPRIAGLGTTGDQRPHPQIVGAIRGGRLGLESEDPDQWAFPRPDASPGETGGRHARFPATEGIIQWLAQLGVSEEFA